jgi:hypothetical protein
MSKAIAGHELVAGFDNIKILKPTGNIQYEGSQILMSGSGCRNYENFLKINKETWFDFLERTCGYNVNFPRIDIAIDDRKPYLHIPELIRLKNEGLTWDDVDFQKREIHVNKTLVYIKDLETKKYVFKYQTPKTKNSIRTIPMQESVYKALKRQRIQKKEMQMLSERWEPLSGFENLVFVGKNGKPITEHSFQVTLDGIEKAINKERKKRAEKEKTEFIPIQHFYPHALRHTFATRCFEAGIEAKVVQGFLGHYSIAITLDLYTHVTNDKAKIEMDKLENLYQEII